MASVHTPVLMSSVAPIMLSSSGTVASEVQPDTNQPTATRLMMNFMDFLHGEKVAKRSISNRSHLIVARLRNNFRVWQSRYTCDLGSSLNRVQLSLSTRITALNH